MKANHLRKIFSPGRGGYGLLSILFFLGSFLSGAQSALFQINSFVASDQSINLEGSSEIVDGKLRIAPDKPNQAGACWYKAEKIDFTHGFETEFTFIISNLKPGILPGDGFAFVIQSQSPEITGGIGDNIGYKEIPYGVALEFDIKDNDEGSRNHINLSFYNPETKSYRQYATVHEIPEITDGKSHFTRVVYRDGRLQIYLDSYLFPVLSVKLDIAEKINSPDHTAWLGFTASTSENHANHDLLSWVIKEAPAAPKDIAVDSVLVKAKGTIEVKHRKLTIGVWDHNTIDGDIVSLKLGDEWILTEHTLTAEKMLINCTLVGFGQDLILYAHNVGMVPPNTASISVYDGESTQRISLESNMESSEAIRIAFTGDE